MELKSRKRKIGGSKDVAPVFRAILETECEVDQGKEHFWVLGLNTKNQIQYLELVTLGLLDQTVVHPREVFRFAVMKGVKSIILVHNHPSGDPQPSSQDRAITERLAEAGKVLGIQVLDHVIVGEHGAYYSFQEAGAM
jgi:DNA repair protein RadC